MTRPHAASAVATDQQVTLCIACRFVTFERDSSVEQVFQVGSMHELSGKRVEVKSATPRGSGPVAGRAGIAEQRMWGPRPMGGRGMGIFPGQVSPQGFGMGAYGAVGWVTCYILVHVDTLHLRIVQLFDRLQACVYTHRPSIQLSVHLV